jgi:uncharacterized repeat protein (TIGR03803 family)
MVWQATKGAVGASGARAALVVFALTGAARAGNYQIVHGDHNGLSPAAPSLLAADSAGNLYGEGTGVASDIFELTASSGYVEEKVIFSFGQGGATEGVGPQGGVTLSPHNTLFGTTSSGGVYGYGTVFSLGRPRTPAFTPLHAFSGLMAKPGDGATPQSGLTPGFSGRYYGTTYLGGNSSNSGSVFSVSGSATDPKYKVLHRFGDAGDGASPPPGRLAVDAEGRLYGVTTLGGANNYGTVFMMEHSNGGWQEQVIYSFQLANDVFAPSSNIVLDAVGNLYGCAKGGSHGRGGVFRLAPPAEGGGLWQETVLYNFGDQPNDPTGVFGCGITIDPATDLIVGTSYFGGSYNRGTLFTLTPPTAGQTGWTEAVAHSFEGSSRNGAYPRDGGRPEAPPVKVGATYYGGNSETGSIYGFTP